MFEYRPISSRSTSVSRVLALLPLIICIGTANLFGQAEKPATKPYVIMPSPEKLSISFAEIVKAIEPAVVNIDTKSKVPDVATKGSAAPGDSEDIMDFFRRQLIGAGQAQRHLFAHLDLLFCRRARRHSLHHALLLGRIDGLIDG